MSCSRSRALQAGKGLCGCMAERAFQPDRICRNVIDLDETPIKITITDTVITARLADKATMRDLAAQLPRVPVCNRSTSTGRQPCTHRMRPPRPIRLVPDWKARTL